MWPTETTAACSGGTLRPTMVCTDFLQAHLGVGVDVAPDRGQLGVVDADLVDEGGVGHGQAHAGCAAQAWSNGAVPATPRQAGGGHDEG